MPDDEVSPETLAKVCVPPLRLTLHRPQPPQVLLESLAPMTCFVLLLCSDPGYKADGEVATGGEKQPEQVGQLHLEDADGHPPQ